MISIKFNIDDKFISLDDATICNICITNKMQLIEYLEYLNNEFAGKNKMITLKIDNEIVDVQDNIEFIPNLFNLNLNEKKNINALYRILKKLYYDKLRADVDSLKEKAASIVKEISMDFDLELIISNDIKEDDLFKVMNLQFDDEDLNFKEKFIKYIFVINELRGLNIFHVCNIHNYFCENDIGDIINELSLRRIKLINLEFDSEIRILPNEIKIVIDNDLCQI